VSCSNVNNNSFKGNAANARERPLRLKQATSKRQVLRRRHKVLWLKIRTRKSPKSTKGRERRSKSAVKISSRTHLVVWRRPNMISNNNPLKRFTIRQ
jgi:hypothetical protein